MLDRSKLKKVTRPATDDRAKIKTGTKIKGKMSSLDHFYIEPFEELVQFYGKEPKEMIVYFPGDNINSFFLERKATYGSNHMKKRECDLTTCKIFLTQSINNVTYHNGDVTDCICEKLPLEVPDTKKPGKMKPNPDLCKYDCYITAYIAHPETLEIISPVPYLFETHSMYSGENILNELDKYRSFIGRPFRLIVKMIKGENKKFPLWYCLPFFTANSLIEYQLKGIDSGEIKKLVEHQKQINEAVSKSLPEPGEMLGTEYDKFFDENQEEETEEETEKNNTSSSLEHLMNLDQVNPEAKEKIIDVDNRLRFINEMHNIFKENNFTSSNSDQTKKKYIIEHLYGEDLNKIPVESIYLYNETLKDLLKDMRNYEEDQQLPFILQRIAKIKK